MGPGNLAGVKPIFEEMEGWDADLTEIRSWSDLPLEACEYILRIEELAEVVRRKFSHLDQHPPCTSQPKVSATNGSQVAPKGNASIFNGLVFIAQRLEFARHDGLEAEACRCDEFKLLFHRKPEFIAVRRQMMPCSGPPGAASSSTRFVTLRSSISGGA